MIYSSIISFYFLWKKEERKNRKKKDKNDLLIELTASWSARYQELSRFSTHLRYSPNTFSWSQYQHLSRENYSQTH